MAKQATFDWPCMHRYLLFNVLLYRIHWCTWKLYWECVAYLHQWSELYWHWGECVGMSSQWNWGIFMQSSARCLCDVPRYMYKNQHSHAFLSACLVCIFIHLAITMLFMLIFIGCPRKDLWTTPANIAGRNVYAQKWAIEWIYGLLVNVIHFTFTLRYKLRAEQL